MGGFFGITSKTDCISEVFFGVDYHSHLGTRRGGMAAFDKEIGLQRVIHNIESTPFKTKFEHVLDDMHGTSAIGCISNSTPQPMLIRSKLGVYAICMIGIINNANELIDLCLKEGTGHFDAMTGGAVNSTELLAALINQKDSFVEGLKFAQEVVDGTISVLILKDDGNIIAARDKVGRLPILIGKNADGYSVSFESFAYQKFGYLDEKDLGPGEIVEITEDGILVNIDGNSNRVAAIAYGPESVIMIVGMNKVAKDVDAAISRARNEAAPINAMRFDLDTPCKKTGSCMNCMSKDTICCEFLITRFSRHPGRIKVILVGEDLGF